MGVNSAKRGRLEGRLARTLVLIAVLNLNGLSFMMFGITQIFSLGMLVCSVSLLLLESRIRIDFGLSLYLFVVLGHLFFGLLFVPIFNDPQAELSYAVSILGTLLLTFSLTQHIMHLRKFGGLDSFLRFIRNTTVMASCPTLISPFLYNFYAYPPPSFEYRNAGLFANPNDAALIAVFAFIMVLMVPFKSRAISLATLVLVAAAAIAPFSRTGIMLIFLIALLAFLNVRPVARIILAPMLVYFVIVIISGPELLIGIIANQNIVELNAQQISRLNTAVLSVSGQLDAETSGGRTELLVIAFDKAMSVFPLGTGLNTFHSMEGGVMGETNWLGAHNSYLMVWGESGVLVFIALALLSFFFIYNSFRSIKPWTNFYLALLFIFCSMTNHEVMSLRFMNIVTAILLGLPKVRGTTGHFRQF